MLRTTAHGEPAAVVYPRGKAYGVLVLTVPRAEDPRVSVFAGPCLLAAFGLPEVA